jgi:hypothetical protein
MNLQANNTPPESKQMYVDPPANHPLHDSGGFFYSLNIRYSVTSAQVNLTGLRRTATKIRLL